MSSQRGPFGLSTKIAPTDDFNRPPARIFAGRRNPD